MIGSAQVPVASLPGPSPMDCYDWDTTFLRGFHGCLLLALVLAVCILLGLVFRPPGWRYTQPYRRIFYSSLPVPVAGALVLVLSQLALLAWPAILSVFRISPDYIDCRGSQFEAAGLLWGLGAGVPAITQAAYMAGISLALWLAYLAFFSAGNYVLSRMGSPWRLKAPKEP